MVIIKREIIIFMQIIQFTERAQQWRAKHLGGHGAPE